MTTHTYNNMQQHSNTHNNNTTTTQNTTTHKAIIDWMAPVAGAAAATFIAGDLNAPPGEAAHAAFASAGYLSASKAANGAEPPVTWPSGLVAPLMDRGEPHCADYVYVKASPGYAVRVAAAALAGDAPAAADATLFPSDHYALAATVAVWREAAAAGSGGGGARR